MWWCRTRWSRPRRKPCWRSCSRGSRPAWSRLWGWIGGSISVGRGGCWNIWPFPPRDRAMRSDDPTEHAQLWLERVTSFTAEAEAVLAEYYEAVSVVKRDDAETMQRLLEDRRSGMWLAR